MIQTTRLRPDLRLRSHGTSTGRFLLHYVQMCAAMCVGFVLGDTLYLWAAGLAGYAQPFAELPELSVLVVTFAMTAPMAVWMLVRGMPGRAAVEMSASMPALALVLLVLGWLAVLPTRELVVLEHALMMPVMLIPMLIRLDLYTSIDHGHGAGR